MALITKSMQPPLRRVKLAPMGMLVRIGWPVLLVLTPGMVLALTFTHVVKKQFLFAFAGLLFVLLLLYGLAVEWLIRRELHRARTWPLCEAVLHDGEWYGLADADGKPLHDSPPIDQLSDEILATAPCRQVLVGPGNPRRIYQVKRPMQLVCIET